jgi:two-component system sensor histidine kinase KdpD
MKRGRLHVFLGAAPGVGKTFAMIEEGQRLEGDGRTVLVGPLETQGRGELGGLLEGLESLDSADWVTEVIGRRPDVVLIDDLARPNPPGSRSPKRWDDIDSILDAGIDVLSTLNIQNLESLNDVVFQITGVRESETVPDHVIRHNADIEVVDLGEQRIRERLNAGKIYPAEKVDATLANFFRPGNLSALRELTLSWAADRVDEALADYRLLHGIHETWDTKERIVVGISGKGGSDVVVRKAARNALRSRAELIGVHVRTSGEHSDDVREELDKQKDLLQNLGGSYHELIGDDVAESLLTFARAENATRIVLGVSHRSRLRDRLAGSTVREAIARAGSIEVNVITYEATGSPGEDGDHHESALSPKRRAFAWLLAVIFLSASTVTLLALDLSIALENVLLIYLLQAVAVGIFGGALPAVASAVSGFLLANWFFTPPFRTWKIADVGHLFALFAFLVVASAVGLLVGNATRRSAEARKARAHAEALAATTTIQRISNPTTGLTTRIRDAFAMSAAAVLRRSGEQWDAIATVGITELNHPDDADEVIPLTDDSVLALSGGSLTGDDRRLLRAFAAQMAQALEREKLETEAAAVKAMVETDRLRTALLNAVSHDLRTPLATIKASVTSLLETEVSWSQEQTQAFLGAILEETEHLNRVVGRLLDASRIQVGAVHVFFTSVGLDEVVSSALAGLGARSHQVSVEIPEPLPAVRTDPALLERVIANLIENALAWSPSETPVRVTAGEVAGRIDLRVIDRGPGIPGEERDAIYQPFQRLGDSPGGSGVGLGMAVARGFLDAMGNEFSIEDTPGGGTTMVIGFDLAPMAEAATSNPTHGRA